LEAKLNLSQKYGFGNPQRTLETFWRVGVICNDTEAKNMPARQTRTAKANMWLLCSCGYYT